VNKEMAELTSEQEELLKKCDMFLRRQNSIGDWEIVGKKRSGAGELILESFEEEKESEDFWKDLTKRLEKEAPSDQNAETEEFLENLRITQQIHSNHPSESNYALQKRR
jgi:hypothetical protein